MRKEQSQMGKKILVLGTGAQGSTVAQRMDEEPNVEKIICADADHKAVDELVKILKKAEGTYVDANDVNSIIEAAQGVDPVSYTHLEIVVIRRVFKYQWQDTAVDQVRSVDPRK